jgi:hypothetical protein
MQCWRRMEKTQIDQTCEKKRRITMGHGGQEHPTNNTIKEV